MGKLREAHTVIETKLNSIHQNFPEYFKNSDLKIENINDSKFFDGQLTYGELKLILDALKIGLDIYD